MIEVLVSLVIFAFGMLGLASLQTRAVTFGHQSLLRSQATALTDDILDRMRADRTNAKAKRWDTDLTDLSSSITGSEIYKADLKDWKASVEKLLPSGKGAVQVDDNFVVTVIIQWDESNITGGQAEQQLTTKSRL